MGKVSARCVLLRACFGVVLCFSVAACQSESAEEYYNQALLAVNQDHYQQAIVLYSKAIALDANYHEARARLAFLLLEEGQLALAKTHCDYLLNAKIYQQNPNYCLGLIAFKQANYPLAITNFSEHLAYMPEYTSARYWLAKAHLANGEAELAEAELNKASSMFSHSVEANLLMHEILVGLGKPEQAKPFREQADFIRSY
ncbi:MAG: tetratricopeptide repeat protein [Gammaproteobacteria bacterium]|nr:tetratricopeptide repeat protein [Gammaproteobacteria bacterium]